MTEECRHAHIRTWVGQDDGKPAGLWSCAECGHKFEPLDIAQQREIARLRSELESAMPAMRDYARKNRTHYMGGAWQDPNGVHSWLQRNDK
jgi:hypothetical protein